MQDSLLEKYRITLIYAIENIEATARRGEKLDTPDAIMKLVQCFIRVKRQNKKIMFIGNGGSASLSSHQAIDYWKNGGIKALAFNDSSLLTCLSNDFGYEYVFQKPVEKFSEKGDILVAISSSGRSRNIINAVKMARKKGIFVVTLSGFDRKNPLRKYGDINFYVPSRSYGIIEISHLIICHSALDYIIEKKL